MKSAFTFGVVSLLLLSAHALAQDSGSSAENSAPIVIVTPPPATLLDSFDDTQGVVLTSTTRGSVIGADDGTALTVIAVDKTIAGKSDHQRGIAIELAAKNGRIARAYVDEQDLAGLIDALNTLSKIDKPASTLTDVDAAYRNFNVRIANVDDNGSRAAVVRVVQYTHVTGEVFWVVARFRGERLSEIRDQVLAAQKALK